MSTKPDRELADIKEMVEENNQMLRKLQTRARIGTTIRLIKWTVFILIALGVYSVAQPFIEQVSGAYSSIQESAATINEIKENITGIDITNIF